MAIAGNATRSFEAQIVDGKLELTRQTLRQNVITDVETAVAELRAGKRIFLHAFYPTMKAVREAIEGDGA